MTVPGQTINAYFENNTTNIIKVNSTIIINAQDTGKGLNRVCFCIGLRALQKSLWRSW